MIQNIEQLTTAQIEVLIKELEFLVITIREVTVATIDEGIHDADYDGDANCDVIDGAVFAYTDVADNVTHKVNAYKHEIQSRTERVLN